MKILKETSTPKHLVNYLVNLGFSFVEEQPADIYLSRGKALIVRLSEYLEGNDLSFYNQIPGTAYITAKDQLWVALVLKVGRENALKILPETIVLRIKKDRKRLLQLISEDKNVRIILKKNMQKRQGLKVIYGHEWEDFAEKGDYVIAQRVLPTLGNFTDRPFHFRSYTILTLRNQKLELWLCSDAKILYGEPGGIITSNDVNLNEEIDLPLFLSEMDHVLHGIAVNGFLQNLSQKLNCVFDSIMHKIADHPISEKQQFAQIFGTDVIITPNNEILIIECNSNPDMKGTSNKDTLFKNAVLRDLFNHFLTKKENSGLKWQQVGQWKLPPFLHSNSDG